MGASTVVLLVMTSVVAVAVVVALVLVLRRRGTPTPAADPAPPAPPEPPPMSGLESALSRVTDRAGRPIREHIDAETAHVDDLRVPDDTGPLLRRALDHVSHADEPKPHPAPTPTADADERDTDEPA